MRYIILLYSSRKVMSQILGGDQLKNLQISGTSKQIGYIYESHAKVVEGLIIHGFKEQREQYNIAEPE